jgi:hypothetical protein
LKCRSLQNSQYKVRSLIVGHQSSKIHTRGLDALSEAVGTEPTVGEEANGTESTPSLTDGRQRGVGWVAAVGRGRQGGGALARRCAVVGRRGGGRARRGGSDDGGVGLVAAWSGYAGWG